jgi:hypothetical protein
MLSKMDFCDRHGALARPKSGAPAPFWLNALAGLASAADIC